MFPIITESTGKKHSHRHGGKDGRIALSKILIPVSAVLLCVCVVLVFLLIMALTGKLGVSDHSTESSANSGTSTVTSMASDTETVPATMTATSSSASVASSESSATIESTTLATTVLTSQSATAATYTNPESMYSSYANITSFDPLTGYATFDYFDMLRGDDAIAWLVDHEGYKQADAKAMVDDFADSEFVLKNANPQLRTVEMKKVSIRMMYDALDQVSDNAETFPMTYAEFCSLYSLNSEHVMNSYFYYITVEDGVVTKAEQVYWP